MEKSHSVFNACSYLYEQYQYSFTVGLRANVLLAEMVYVQQLLYTQVRGHASVAVMNKAIVYSTKQHLVKTNQPAEGSDPWR